MDECSKMYYKIQEVSEILNVPQSTLRFWEKEFPQIKPTRNAGNVRYYRPNDIETLRVIKFLVKERGLKIDAAKEQLRSNRKNVSKRLEVIDSLKDIRNELAGLLIALGGRKI